MNFWNRQILSMIIEIRPYFLGLGKEVTRNRDGGDVLYICWLINWSNELGQIIYLFTSDFILCKLYLKNELQKPHTSAEQTQTVRCPHENQVMNIL